MTTLNAVGGGLSSQIYTNRCSVNTPEHSRQRMECGPHAQKSPSLERPGQEELTACS